MFETRINKALSDELARLDRLLRTQERSIQSAFNAFLRDARSERTIREIADLVERGDVEGALRIIDSYVTRMGAVMPQVVQATGSAESAAVAPLFEGIAPAVAISFDPTNPRAAALARQATLEFIRYFTDEQRAATRIALAEAFTVGAGPRSVERAIRDSIGLTPYQQRTVANYRRLLEQGSAEALDRANRDRRYDRTVRRASRSNEPLTREQIDRMTERYRDRTLMARGETIARTEATRVVTPAREESFRQAMEDAGVDQGLAEATWRTNMDGRERATHGDLNGQTRAFVGGVYRSSSGAVLRYPGDPQAPPAEIINCRCHETFRLRTNAA